MLQNTWQHVGAHPAPLLVLTQSLYVGVLDLQGVDLVLLDLRTDALGHCLMLTWPGALIISLLEQLTLTWPWFFR
jgi:hypothetical protein